MWYLWDGGANREKILKVAAGTAEHMANTSSRNSVQVSQVGQWSHSHVPSTATKATYEKAAGGAGVRHVCTAITATIAADSTAQTPLKITLYDGTSAGTVLWSASVSAAANTVGGVAITGLNIVGSANTKMTLEFSAAGVTGSQQIVSLTGYSTS